MVTAGDELPGPPPRLFERPAAAGALPEPLASSEALAVLRRRWAQLRGAPVREPADAMSQPARAVSGVRAKVRAKVVNAAAGVQAAERAMTGDLVHALDAVARRVDELGARVADLERLVEDVVDTVSEDLVRVHEVLDGAASHAAPGTPGPPGRNAHESEGDAPAREHR